MSRFATDLFEYFRDLLIVKAGGENSHHSPLFEENLSLEQDRLFQLIDLVTSALPEIKTGTHPKNLCGNVDYKIVRNPYSGFTRNSRGIYKKS